VRLPRGKPVCPSGLLSLSPHLSAAHLCRPLQDLRAKLLLLSDGDGQQLIRLQDDNTQLRRELAASERTVAELEQRLAVANSKLQSVLEGAPCALPAAGRCRLLWCMRN